VGGKNVLVSEEPMIMLKEALLYLAVLHILTVSCTERLEIAGNPDLMVIYFEYDAVVYRAIGNRR
jgi:hypothetical protein